MEFRPATIRDVGNLARSLCRYKISDDLALWLRKVSGGRICALLRSLRRIENIAQDRPDGSLICLADMAGRELAQDSSHRPIRVPNPRPELRVVSMSAHTHIRLTAGSAVVFVWQALRICRWTSTESLVSISGGDVAVADCAVPQIPLCAQPLPCIVYRSCCQDQRGELEPGTPPWSAGTPDCYQTSPAGVLYPTIATARQHPASVRIMCLFSTSG